VVLQESAETWTWLTMHTRLLTRATRWTHPSSASSASPTRCAVSLSRAQPHLRLPKRTNLSKTSKKERNWKIMMMSIKMEEVIFHHTIKKLLIAGLTVTRGSLAVPAGTELTSTPVHWAALIAPNQAKIATKTQKGLFQVSLISLNWVLQLLKWPIPN